MAKLYKLHSRNLGFRLYSRAADHGEQVARRRATASTAS